MSQPNTPPPPPLLMWRPLVEAAARPLPTLAVLSAWQACLRSAGLLPLAPAGPGARRRRATAGKGPPVPLVRNFLAVLAARKTALDAAQQRGDHNSTVFGPARGQAPDACRGQLGAGPLPRPTARPPLDAPEGLPPHWPWEAAFLHALLRWPWGPCCGSRARAKSHIWNWPGILRSMRAGLSRRLWGTSWQIASCHFANGRTCSSSRSTKRNSFCVLVSLMGASCARNATH